MSRVRSVALALTLAGSASAAESVAVIGVAEPPGPAPDLAALAGRLRAAVAFHHPGVIDAARLRERMIGAAPAATLEELDRAYAAALAAHAAGDFDGALDTLRQVVQQLEQLPPGAEAQAQWTRTLLRLARAEQATGRREAALGTLARLVRGAPEIQADEGQFPPSFQRLLQEARAQVKGAGTRRLTVQSEPGVRVFVEGREVGAAPLSVELPPGRYRVAGQRGEVRVPVVLADLGADEALVHLDVSLAEALRPDAGPGLSLPAEGRAARLVACSGRLEADRVVAAALASEGDSRFLVATLHDVRRGSQEREGRLRLRGGEPPPGGLDALAAFLVTGRTSDLLDGGPSQGPPSPPPPAVPLSITAGPPSAPRTSGPSWHGPAATATLLAGLALGGVAWWQGASADRSYREARQMLDGSGQAVREPYSIRDHNQRVTEGDRARAIAVGTGAGAATALALTAVLGYLGWRESGEVGLFRF